MCTDDVACDMNVPDSDVTRQKFHSTLVELSILSEPFQGTCQV